MDRIQEIQQELKETVFANPVFTDGVLPSVLFFVLYSLIGMILAIAISGLVVILVILWRLQRKNDSKPVLFGGIGLFVSYMFVRLYKTENAFIAPNIISGIGTVIALIISLIAGKPLVAITSTITRGWPIRWYWHPKVKPAYTEVTFVWTVFFALRTVVQLGILNRLSAEFVIFADILLGFPSLLMLLVASYLYGIWRLRNLDGPSVEEFKNKKPPPWEGQKRGF